MFLKIVARTALKASIPESLGMPKYRESEIHSQFPLQIYSQLSSIVSGASEVVVKNLIAFVK